MKIEANPCPFCGEKNHLSFTSSCEDREGTPVSVVCETCGCTGPWVYDMDWNGTHFSVKAIKLWNNRTFK